MRVALIALTLLAAAEAHATNWSVAVIGPADDPRVLAVREAVAHWNRELIDLGTSLRLGPVRQADGPRVDESVLQDTSEGMLSRRWFRNTIDLRVYHADIVILLSCSELISVGVEPRRDQPGMVILREGDDPPLSLPNVARNVIAHELGHVLGISHDDDPTLLMCGRPAPCRPAVFQSKDLRWFPLSDEEKAYLRRRWSE